MNTQMPVSPTHIMTRQGSFAQSQAVKFVNSINAALENFSFDGNPMFYHIPAGYKGAASALKDLYEEQGWTVEVLYECDAVKLKFTYKAKSEVQHG